MAVRGGSDTDYVSMGIVGEGVSGDNINSLGRLSFALRHASGITPSNLLGGFDGEVNPYPCSRDAAEILNSRTIVNRVCPSIFDGSFHGQPRALTGCQSFPCSVGGRLLGPGLPLHLSERFSELPRAFLQCAGGGLRGLRAGIGGFLNRSGLTPDFPVGAMRYASVDGGGNEGEPRSNRKPLLQGIVAIISSAMVSLYCFWNLQFGDHDWRALLGLLILCFFGIMYGTEKLLDAGADQSQFRDDSVTERNQSLSDAIHENATPVTGRWLLGKSVISETANWFQYVVLNCVADGCDSLFSRKNPYIPQER